MRQLKLFRWAAALMLTIAVAPGMASAQEPNSLTISSTFSMAGMGGTVGADLAEVFANGHDHTWTLTLHGVSQSHSTVTYFGGALKTTIHVQSFDFEFFGPDAATLNDIVSEHIAGGEVTIELYNSYSWHQAFLWVEVFGPDASFWIGHDTFGSETLFPSDAAGYPVVGPEPFSIESEYSWLADNRDGNNGAIEGWYSLVTFQGSAVDPEPNEPVLLAIEDATVAEGNRGTTRLDLTVILSREPDDVVTVDYETVDGSAKQKSDYTATSGTLTFQPGQTSRTISIAIKADRKREPHEIFYVELFNADGATIVDGVATATIVNDD